jgi:hypothetical protein
MEPKTGICVKFPTKRLVGNEGSIMRSNHGFWSRRFALAAGNSDSDHSVAGVVLAPLIKIERAAT